MLNQNVLSEYKRFGNGYSSENTDSGESIVVDENDIDEERHQRIPNDSASHHTSPSRTHDLRFKRQQDDQSGKEDLSLRNKPGVSTCSYTLAVKSSSVGDVGTSRSSSPLIFTTHVCRSQTRTCVSQKTQEEHFALNCQPTVKASGYANTQNFLRARCPVSNCDASFDDAFYNNGKASHSVNAPSDIHMLQNGFSHSFPSKLFDKSIDASFPSSNSCVLSSKHYAYIPARPLVDGSRIDNPDQTCHFQISNSFLATNNHISGMYDSESDIHHTVYHSSTIPNCLCLTKPIHSIFSQNMPSCSSSNINITLSASENHPTVVNRLDKDGDPREVTVSMISRDVTVNNETPDDSDRKLTNEDDDKQGKKDYLMFAVHSGSLNNQLSSLPNPVNYDRFPSDQRTLGSINSGDRLSSSAPSHSSSYLPALLSPSSPINCVSSLYLSALTSMANGNGLERLLGCSDWSQKATNATNDESSKKFTSLSLTALQRETDALKVSILPQLRVPMTPEEYRGYCQRGTGNYVLSCI